MVLICSGSGAFNALKVASKAVGSVAVSFGRLIGLCVAAGLPGALNTITAVLDMASMEGRTQGRFDKLELSLSLGKDRLTTLP